MCFIAFLVGVLLGGITYRWYGPQIEEFLDWALGGK